MKAIDGKLAAVFVAAAIGATGLFAPTTARASEQLNFKTEVEFINQNSDTLDVLIQYLPQDLVNIGRLALQEHNLNFIFADGFESGDTSMWQRSEASGMFGEGMSAGTVFGLGEEVSIWGSGSHSSSENDFAATAYDSDTRSASFGADVRVDEIATLGAFLSFSHTDTDSSFNNGGSETETISFGPYVSATVNENVYFDASFGFLFLESDNTRTPAGAAAAITGSQRGTGLFGSANLNYTRWIEAFNFNGRLGVTAANVRNDDYVDSTGTLNPSSGAASVQLQLEAQASYFFDNFSPFVRVGFNIEDSPDISTAPGTPQPANDKDEFVVGGGVNLFGLGPVTGGISYSRTLAHSDFDSWTVTGQISIALGGN